MSKVFDLWNEVGGAFGPSGREDAVREAIAAIAGEYIDDITTDALGNLICRKKGAGKKVLFAAHMDSIGVVATWIDDKGFIRFSQVGGLFKGDLINITVRFANGTRGVISYEEKTPFKDLTLDNLFIDIGAKDKADAEQQVQIGDFAVFEAPRFEQNGVLCGPYLDNRIGCVTLLLALEQLAEAETENDLYFVFTSQEEVGLRGAGAAAFSVEPDGGRHGQGPGGQGDGPLGHLHACGVRGARAGGRGLRRCHPARDLAVRRHGHGRAAKGTRRRAGGRRFHPDTLHPLAQ